MYIININHTTQVFMLASLACWRVIEQETDSQFQGFCTYTDLTSKRAKQKAFSKGLECE